jgi:hypothetical protein
MSDDQQIADELTYRSYRYNRERFPEIPPERYVMAYPNGAELEKRYQAEAQRYAEAAIRSAKERPKWLRELLQGARDIPNGQ